MDLTNETLATARRIRHYGGNVFCIEGARFTRQMAQLRATLSADEYGAFLLRLRLQLNARLRERVHASADGDQAEADGGQAQTGIEAV